MDVRTAIDQLREWQEHVDRKLADHERRLIALEQGEPPLVEPHRLCTVSSWNVNNEGWGAPWQLEQLQAGNPITPTIRIPMPNYGNTIDDYPAMRELIAFARDHLLPLVFRLDNNLVHPFTGIGIDYPYYQELPIEQSPCCWWIDEDGPSACTSSNGALTAWRHLGRDYWGSSDIIQEAREIYPDPPRVVVLDNNEGWMLSSGSTPTDKGDYRDRDRQWISDFSHITDDDESELKFRELWYHRFAEFRLGFQEATGWMPSICQYGGWDVYPADTQRKWTDGQHGSGFDGAPYRVDAGCANCYYKHYTTGEYYYGHLITTRAWYGTEYNPWCKSIDPDWQGELSIDADRQRIIEALAADQGYHDPERVAGCAAFLAFVTGQYGLRYYRNAADTLTGEYITAEEAAARNVPHYTWSDYSDALVTVAKRINELPLELLTGELLTTDLDYPTRMFGENNPKPPNPLFSTERSGRAYDNANGDHRLYGWFEWPDYVAVRSRNGKRIVAAFSPNEAEPLQVTITLNGEPVHVVTSRRCEFTELS